ncbi:MAG: hypothetical protein HY720_06755 [Planctomycetes bacterium]|nr:hypothetical protein [Planctomycetota bacterium]
MTTAEAIRRGVTNSGGFFSPYYLFDLMARRHGGELDPDGRERERRNMPRVYRKAMARLDSGGTLAELWRAWYGDLFETLGFQPQAVRGGIGTARHGRVPVSHFETAPGGGGLALVDLHALGTDLDRDFYDADAVETDAVTSEPISRAFELALDHQGLARWGLLSNGTELRLYRKGSPVSRQYVAVHFDALFDADRDDEWTAFWGLFRKAAFLPGPDGSTSFIERILAESHRHAGKIAKDLRENAVHALEALVQGVLDEKENARLWDGGLPDREALERLYEESIYYLYRILFVLYAESRDILPVGESPVYRDTYSFEHLRDLAEREPSREEESRTYYVETLRTLFRLLRTGFRSSEFAVPALGGRGPDEENQECAAGEIDPRLTSLFDARRTALLDRCTIRDLAMRRVVRELSLSRPKKKRERSERYSYADLGVDQLGSIYEGLLVYEPAVAAEEMVLARIGSEDRRVTRAEAEEHGLAVVSGSERATGSFLLRVWGGRRKLSGSYYTPQEFTAFLVREALEPVVNAILERAAKVWAAEVERATRDSERAGKDRAPVPRTLIAEEILEIKVLDPAMGSGAFLIQACRYLADAYGRAKIAEGRDESGRIEGGEFVCYKRLVAERCLYGVDVNPLAVELAKVSLWLETLAHDRPLGFLDAHLRCGDSLVGAPLRDRDGNFTDELVSTIPNEAYKTVSEHATDEARNDARAALRRNRGYLKKVGETEGYLIWGDRRVRAQGFLAGMAPEDPRIDETLERYLESRKLFDRTDAGVPAEEALQLREEKEREFARTYLAPIAPVHRLKDALDLWCAAWFWPEEEGAPARYASEEYQGAVRRILAGEAFETPWLETARSIARERRFFHWELEFPEVFLRERGGFDAVVGNPPWEKVSAAVGDVAEEFDPFLNSLTGEEYDSRTDDLLNDPGFGPLLLVRSRAFAQYSHVCRKSPFYRGLVSGDVNTFGPFTVLAWSVLRLSGSMALVVKDAFHLAKGEGELRAEILASGCIRLLATADNERRVFDAHHLLRFDLLVASRGASGRSVPISVQRFRTAEEIVAAAKDGAAVPISRLLDDDGRPTRGVPEILDSAWPELMERAAGARSRDARVHWGRELHGSIDKACWSRDQRPERSPGPVIGMIAPFDALHYPPAAWLIDEARTIRSFRIVVWGKWRVAVRDRADQKNERVLIAAIVPRESATHHYLNVCREPAGDARFVLSTVALANSLLLDYLARPSVGIHMSSGILNELPWFLPIPEPHEPPIVEDALRLTAIRPEFDDLPREAGHLGIAPARSPVDRAAARARLDARVAAIYGLTALEWARVLAWFRLLDQDQRALPGEPKSYVTRDLALLEFFRLSGDEPPRDIVPFYREAGVDLAGVTGEIRGLEERIRAAEALGAVAYLPSRRGGGRAEDEIPDHEGED